MRNRVSIEIDPSDLAAVLMLARKNLQEATRGHPDMDDPVDSDHTQFDYTASLGAVQVALDKARSLA